MTQTDKPYDVFRYGITWKKGRVWYLRCGLNKYN